MIPLFDCISFMLLKDGGFAAAWRFRRWPFDGLCKSWQTKIHVGNNDSVETEGSSFDVIATKASMLIEMYIYCWASLPKPNDETLCYPLLYIGQTSTKEVILHSC